ncbi:MAG: Gamma-glutamyl-gamma-aminobutyrate hydrolase PuuD [Holosporales bacterium]
MRKKPVVGITLDSFDPLENENARWFSKDYWYALRSQYIEAIVEHGGIPFLLPHHDNLVVNFVEKIDGLLLTGGGFDVPPDYYSALAHEKTRLKIRRSEFEKKITLEFLKKQKPLLGICGGMQLLCALYDGVLFQYLPDEGCFKEHTQDTPRHEPWHHVKILKGSKLSRIYNLQDQDIPVNSVHQQAVKNAGRLAISAFADDGLIEGIEDPSHPFCIGVQWHPECFVSDFDHILFKAFIEASK